MTEVLKNIISFVITADEDVDQNFISITFSATEKGTDPNIVQEALAVRVKEALDIARPVEVVDQIEVRSGNFQITQSYNNKGVVNGYEGNAIIIVSGIDTKTIVALTGKIKSMNVSGVQQSVSASRRKEVEQILSLKAIKLWREKATAYADAFGSSSYTLVSADVGINNRYPVYARAMSKSLESADSGEISTEAGRETLTATVTGSVQIC